MITIRKVETSDHKNIIGLLLTDFFPYEPCAVGLDLCPLGYRIPPLESDIRNILLKGWSFLAEDMDQVVGVVICDLQDKNQSELEKDGVFPKKFHQLERFFDDLKSPCDLFEKTERVLDLFILCTSTSHRGRGIAGQLVRTTMDSARSEGLKGVVSMGLSNYSQKIFRRMGFEERNCIEYSDYTQDGENIFDTSKMEDHTQGILFTTTI